MKKPVKRSIGGNIALIVLLLILGAFSALPFVYSILQSLKPLDELFVFPPRFFVVRPTTDNYYLLWTNVQESWVPFTRYLFNSIFVSVTATALHVVVSSMAAFPLAKSNFPGRNAISKLIVLSLLFTGGVTSIPQFVLMARTGFMNSYWAMILPWVAGSMGLYLMQQFMTQLPTAMIEAAKVDGAGMFRILWTIVMPSVKPAWLTLIIFTFQGIWNSGGGSFITKENLNPTEPAFSGYIFRNIAYGNGFCCCGYHDDTADIGIHSYPVKRFGNYGSVRHKGVKGNAK